MYGNKKNPCRLAASNRAKQRGKKFIYTCFTQKVLLYGVFRLSKTFYCSYTAYKTNIDLILGAIFDFSFYVSTYTTTRTTCQRLAAYVHSNVINQQSSNFDSQTTPGFAMQRNTTTNWQTGPRRGTVYD